MNYSQVKSIYAQKQRVATERVATNLLMMLALALLISACCTPKQRNSLPQVVLGSYADTSIKNAYPVPANPGDSGYYPIYTLALKNVGSEADSFSLTFSRGGYQFPRQGLYPNPLTQYVAPGQTVTFRTPGPLKDTASINPWNYYTGFFVSTSDSIPINVMQPTLTVSYGAINNGPEGCNSNPETMQIDVNSLHH